MTMRVRAPTSRRTRRMASSLPAQPDTAPQSLADEENRFTPHGFLQEWDRRIEKLTVTMLKGVGCGICRSKDAVIAQIRRSVGLRLPRTGTRARMPRSLG